MYGMYPFPFMFGVPMNFQGKIKKRDLKKPIYYNIYKKSSTFLGPLGVDGIGQYPYAGGRGREDEEYEGDYYQEGDGWKDQNYYYNDRKKGGGGYNNNRDQEKDYGGKRKNNDKSYDKNQVRTNN